MNSLKIENLSYKYGDIEALNNISFQINDGLIGVLGPNGAGKTTIMKLITTLFSIQQGNITLNNLDYKKDLKDIRRQIGYLPQSFSVYKNLKGREILEIVGDLKAGCDKRKLKINIDEIIEKLDMNKYIDRKVKEYSGGMNQKLGFAQALIGNPSLVVVDEPTVGLDPEQRNNIRELFPLISKEKIMIATTHIVEDIEHYCNYLIVINDGVLIYKGTKQQFINEIQGSVWEADVDIDTLEKIRTQGKVITTMTPEDYLHIKYISKEPLTSNSVQAKINLQDAYIAHNAIGLKREKV